MSQAQYLTLDDIELFYSGGEGHPFQLASDFMEITKATGDLGTGITGVLNRVYGALIWAAINQEANAFGALPKVTWVRSGFRAKTAFGTSADTDISISETATLPSAVYPAIETVSANPKMQAIVFDVTDILEAMATATQDDIWGAAHAVRAEIGTEFAKRINQQLTHKVAELPATRPNSLETIDRIVSKHGEQGFTTGWEDIYSLSRSTGTDLWSASYVDDASALRPLTDTMIRNLIQNVRLQAGNPSLFITGYDTYAAIQGLYYNFVRYMPMSEAKVQFGVNGVQTAAGLSAGLQVGTLYNIPLIQTMDAANAGGTNEISRLYALDTTDVEGYGFPRFALSVLRPLEYFESRDYVLLNKFVVRGVYRFVGENVCRTPHGQGKIRDITP